MIGLLGRKKGMSAIFDNKGRHSAVTVIEAGPCPVVQIKTQKTDGYEALQLGFDPVRPRRVTKPVMGHFEKNKLQPHRLLREFRNFDTERKVGDVLKVDLFQPGDKVDVTGISKGRGFTGVIKRHGFHRPVQSHGTHEKFRGGGSVGAASYPARVWPGHKMPGRMGGKGVTVKNLLVMKIDADKGLMIIKGHVPGAANGYLFIRKRG